MAADDGFTGAGSHELDFLVYGRRARTRRLTLNEKKAQLARTVNRVPEVVVKVSGGGKTALHVKSHMNYITRNGRLEAITDEGERISGKSDVNELHDAWDLDATNGQGRFRMAFNVVLSMPAGTAPHRLFLAAQDFAREQFYGRHQYLMVLHTPETDPHPKPPRHPHVHLVIKAEGHDGTRLHIHKATLEQWRGAFAEKLRDLGIEANASPRDIRGQTRKSKSTGLHHAEQRGESTVLKRKFEQARQELSGGLPDPKPWEEAIVKRHKTILQSLLHIAGDLRRDGDATLASAVERYAKELPRPETERHQIRQAIIQQVQQQQNTPEPKHRDAATRDEKER